VRADLPRSLHAGGAKGAHVSSVLFWREWSRPRVWGTGNGRDRCSVGDESTMTVPLRPGRRSLVLARNRAANNGRRRGHKKKIPAAAGQSPKERRHQASDICSLRRPADAVEPFSLRHAHRFGAHRPDGVDDVGRFRGDSQRLPHSRASMISHRTDKATGHGRKPRLRNARRPSGVACFLGARHQPSITDPSMRHSDALATPKSDVMVTLRGASRDSSSGIT
jgi:hypothetical protein